MARRSRTPSGSSGESPIEHELGHVVVVGGSLAEWAGFGVREWESRLKTVSAGVASSGAAWVTLIPRDGDPTDAPRVRRILSSVGGATDVEGNGSRVEVRNDSVTVVVDVEADGRRRFAAAVTALRESGVAAADITEQLLAAEVLRPAVAEPDLVVILGPPDRLPGSLMWELAYSELVFLDIGWDALDSSHLEVAVEDFHRRNRRFGGLDS